jgi:hypothetical protein
MEQDTELLASQWGPPDGASEDELDWLENHRRSSHEASRLDAAVIGIAVLLTAVVIATTIRLLKLL